jgi:hypothetical protein
VTYLVLHVRDFDFKSDRNDERVQGSSVIYVDPTAEPEKNERGLSPVKVSVKAAVGRSFTAVPGWYQLDFTMRSGRDGKPRVELVGAQLEAPADFSQSIE